MAVAVCFGLSAVGARAEAPIVKIDSGPVLGTEVGGLLSFRGIPYAAPPVDDLRWKPPQLPRQWKAPLDATQFGPSCAQNADLGVFAKAGGQEDCLYLNVFAPGAARGQNEKLPVIVWIHGGKLWTGSSSDYDPVKLVKVGNVIVVSINYRLGLLGFFAHPAIDHEGHGFANYGMLDQRFAFDWVRRNIAAFGGDPQNVTIAGESSGGDSVLAQIISPGSAGTFQRAIMMSAGGFSLKYPNFGSHTPLPEAEELGAGFAKAVGCSPSDAACVRKVPLAVLLSKQTPYMVVQPIIDGSFMPIEGAQALRAGKFNRVPVMNGSTLDEATFFDGLPENGSGVALDDKGYVRAIKDYYGEAFADKVLKEYPASDYTTPSDAYAAAVTSSNFSCVLQAENRWLSAKTSVYAFEFADRTAPTYLEPTTFALGAYHTGDIPYIFQGFHGAASRSVTLNPLQEKLSDSMIRLWADFSRGEFEKMAWARFDPAKENMMYLVLPAPRMVQGRYSVVHKCDFWDKIGLY